MCVHNIDIAKIGNLYSSDFLGSVTLQEEVFQPVANGIQITIIKYYNITSVSP